ncbi:hepatitis A virus cellular receptor 2 isoform X2 [Marmota marmota marmota]|uniref:hepatitis A virus cellular receptor 2 isoform X2 n=1 Tax=Marmota marmota marmota TaxID=9994 RepID=UPI002092AA47|nr:hepatitis A virus cellular receptor 2 isoform X2 [Marmota marmota marmota]
MFSHLSFNGILLLLLLLLLTMSSEGEYIVEVGQDASLPCSYNPISSKSLVPVCWGKESCPVFGCKDLVLSTDETNVKDQKSSRYQLKGNLHKGDVSLTIVNVTPADSGTYCCRIQFRGPVNDYKLNVELIIKPAKVNPAPTAQRDVTTVLPRMLTTEGHGSVETQTLGTFHDKNQTISTFADEFQSFGATTRRGLYIGVGISAGLALTLIFSALILKWYSHRKKKLQNSSLITLANPRPSGLANAAADRMRSEENIYIIEENIYEMEDPNEDYCYISSEQQY